MRKSSLFIAIALSVSGLACAGSGIHTDGTRLSRVSGGEMLTGLWIDSQEAQSSGDIGVAYRSNQAVSDLWIKTGSDSSPEGALEKYTPRLDSVLSRLTPASTTTFVKASDPTKAHQ